jgi:hypothetical protein
MRLRQAPWRAGWLLGTPPDADDYDYREQALALIFQSRKQQLTMNTWIEAYTRCMDGECFRGPTCPRDGSHNDNSKEIARLVATMRAKGVAPRLEALVNHGYAGSLEEVIVLEVASPDTAPDLLWAG